MNDSAAQLVVADKRATEQPRYSGRQRAGIAVASLSLAAIAGCAYGSGASGSSSANTAPASAAAAQGPTINIKVNCNPSAPEYQPWSADHTIDASSVGTTIVAEDTSSTKQAETFTLRVTKVDTDSHGNATGYYTSLLSETVGGATNTLNRAAIENKLGTIIQPGTDVTLLAGSPNSVHNQDTSAANLTAEGVTAVCTKSSHAPASVQ